MCTLGILILKYHQSLFKLTLTTIWFIPRTGIGKFNAMLVNAPAYADRIVTLCGLVKTLRVAIRRICTNEVAIQTTSHSSTRTIGLLKATAPFACVNDVVLIQIARVNEWFDAFFILSKKKLYFFSGLIL